MAANTSEFNGQPEPWLRGPIAQVHPLVMPVFFSFAQVREDLAKHTTDLPREQVWQRVGKASLGFHLKHLAGSVDRLTTYLTGGQLSEEQLRFLRKEAEGTEEIQELLQMVHEALAASEEKLRAVDPHSLYEKRVVGRKELPTSVIGLLVHIAEHTQRHLGQAITLSQVLPQKT
ncbi:MAG: DinB family protein [Bryobacteraceae bacterium]